MSTSHLTKLKRKATEFEQKKLFDKALSLYIQVIEDAGRDLDDADLQLYNRVADLLTRQGNVTEGLAYYEKAVDMYAERGFLNNAIALCNKILRQSPARTAVYYKLGKISASKGFKSDARKNFLEYADRMQKAGQRDEAFRALKEFADLCPDQDDIRLMLADMLTRDSRSMEAIEQLEQLYTKLQAEGRDAEARATVERMRAIDPNITPRTTGNFQVVKNNDLVFLDLADAGVPVAAPMAARERTPIPPLPAIETIDVSGVAALQGLTITFLPDESGPWPDPSGEPAAPLQGLEITADRDVLAPVVASLPDLEVISPVDLQDAGTLLLDIEEGDAGTEDEVIVPHVDGLASAVVTLTGAHPTLAPLLGDPPLSGREFGDLLILPNDETVEPPSHDLLLPSELPLMVPPPALDPSGVDPAILPLLEETPDAWVQVALEAPRDDFRLDRLLTPLEMPAIPSGREEPAGGVMLPDKEATSDITSPVAGSGDGLGDAPEVANETVAAEGMVESGNMSVEPPLASVDVTDALSGFIADGEAHTEPLDSPEFDFAARLGALPDAALSLTRDAGPGDEEGGARSEGLGRAGGGSGEADGPPDDTSVPPEGAALDTSALRALFTSSTADADAIAARDAALEAAFSEDRVELPLIDLENDAAEDTPAEFQAAHVELDELLSAQPSFEGEAPSDFEPEPLNLAAAPPSNEEWTRPEVLIDGEWRDEHVGDLVSGEMFVVGERRDVEHPVAPSAPFDDLAAAMLYAPEDGDGPGTTTSSTPGSFSARPTPHAALSFGGSEAQLRRRLELNPDDFTLRRQLAEALLDLGDREGGLGELERVVNHLEGRGELEQAGAVLDVILRVVPLSVRHHQKRVEYAARSGNRPRLVEAYTELGDALFRCGEPDKARVVYSRVLELAPANERARFAIGMLSQFSGATRSSDDIPAIETGPLSGIPSFTMATLTPESSAGLAGPGAPGNTLQFIAPEPITLDDEVNAAFDAPEPRSNEVKRRTAELEAVESWAADQTAPAAAADATNRSDGHFVNLGEWLRGEGPPRSTRMVAADVSPTGDEQADFAEMLRRFKAGVEENVDAEDFASHYDLGVAFKEMGLVDEAIGQFQRALRGASTRVCSYEALGQCFVEKGQFDVALTLLSRAAEHGGVDELTLVGVLYLLGYASEQVGRRPDAMRYYQRVFAVDIGFRDVAARLAALERAPT